jgi:hypothetical protein
MLQSFADLPRLEAEGRVATVGASTKSDFRYARAWWEISSHSTGKNRESTSRRRWVAYAKGEPFSQFYSNVSLVVNWGADGYELKADISHYRESRGWGDQWSAALNGHKFYFLPALTWSRRSRRVVA